MLRVVLSLVAVPIMLVAILTGAMEMSEGRLGSVNMETFELGLLPIVVAAALILVAVFLPLLWVASRLANLSWWSAAIAGFVSVSIPVLIASWSVLTNGALRWNYKVERFGDHYLWLVLGVAGGLLFWLLAVFRNSALKQRSK